MPANFSELHNIAVLIPCYNEELTIGKVIDDFRAQLPLAKIHVYDNCCTDRTAEIAREHGAIVTYEPRKGKGFVIESMFDQIRADYYVMVDGDDTYPADRVHELLAAVINNEADMALGARLSVYEKESFRPLHVAGNNFVRWMINTIFGEKLTDILSGYRAYNNRIVRTIPVVSAGFEVETEMTIQILYYRLKIKEIVVPYGSRPEGSFSKLSTFRDGMRVIWKIFSLVRAIKPLSFFGSFGILFFVCGIIAGAFPLSDYIRYNYIYHVPFTVLATGLMIISALSMLLGILLHAINWRLKEMHNVVVREKH